MSEKSDWEKLKRKEDILREAAEAIRVQEKDLPRVVARFKKELNEMKKEISSIKSDLSESSQ